MTKKKLTFILMKSRYKSIGKLYAMTHQGAIVINRKSLNIDVPYKNWDKLRNRVKSNHPEFKRINNTIEERVKAFEIENENIPNGDDSQCALAYMKKRIPNSGLTIASVRKYEEILRNFEAVIFYEFKLQSLPFKMLRDISFIRLLKSEIRKSRKEHNKFKTNKGLLTYMTVFGKYVEDWNSNSGTQFPINIRPFTTEIGKDPKKIATTLSHDELMKLIDYTPTGYMNGQPQLLSKNIFLFQYHTGGIRIQDALTLTNKEIVNEGFQINIKKTKEVELFPFCIEQVECLKPYYTSEYKLAVETIKLGELHLSPSNILVLNKIGGVENINNIDILEFQKVVNDIKQQSIQRRELLEITNSLIEIEELFKVELTKHFFSLIRKRPQSFLFPRLDWNLFCDAYSKNGNRDFNKLHEDLIHKAEAGHNSNLKRISECIDIPKMTGHTPRHTLANHLLEEGYSEEEIQKVLVHSSINTTKHYLKRRHQNKRVNKTISEATVIFRKKRMAMN